MGYQRKRVEELDDLRLKFEISTIIPREGLEICLLSGIERVSPWVQSNLCFFN